MRQLGHLIDGAWRHEGGGEELDVDPAAPDTVLATFMPADEQLAAEAVASAAAAHVTWSRTRAHARAAILDTVGRRLAERADELGTEIAREMGKTLAEGVGEARRTGDVFRYFAAEAERPSGEIYYSARPGETIQVHHQPVGVIGAITPWNFPLFIPAFKIAPALLYGNTVVWKPSEITPLVSTLLAEELAAAGLPPGVLNVVIAAGPVGESIVTSPDVAAVSFTGSTAVGKHLNVLAAQHGKPLQAEMGGKNAAVVLADADLDHAAGEVVKGAMSMAGQKCTATSRVIVEEGVYEPLLERVLERVRSIRPGPPLEPASAMGPLASERQRGKVVGHVSEASAGGARVLAGGEPYADGPLSAGYFFPPTVLESDPSARIWREEVFGPVLAAVPARDVDHAFELANDTTYGLSGSVFTSNLGRAQEAIERIDVGMLHVNSETTGADPHVPFGGVKDSGGHVRELGRSARDFYTHIKTVYLRP